MTTDTPLTRYSATNGALASGFITAKLHHLMVHDRTGWRWISHMALSRAIIHLALGRWKLANTSHSGMPWPALFLLS
ncbi:hypothetical protein [Mesorhizobium dulcispinae]|uniref:hypothetical protein n=1 Tax=Mesorhizobium dulcispinae TaxID=3072316 RepID=UPI002A244538|nr:hypothetical protein [Mesorhizobium sp. VK23D]MDX8522406.1 hypothetical protein [Mesorhizobium sp. VK23D]